MSANDEQKECGRILADYATDMVTPNPLDTVEMLANAGFGTEAGAILSCIFSSGPKIHPLPRGYTVVEVLRFKEGEDDKNLLNEPSGDEILIITGVDITSSSPTKFKLAYCYRIRYASFGKISHIYPCTKDELEKYVEKAKARAQESQQAPPPQQVAPPRRAGLRRRMIEEEVAEEPEEEEEVNENEQ
jgi:hypothetical protein